MNQKGNSSIGVAIGMVFFAILMFIVIEFIMLGLTDYFVMYHSAETASNLLKGMSWEQASSLANQSLGTLCLNGFETTYNTTVMGEDVLITEITSTCSWDFMGLINGYLNGSENFQIAHKVTIATKTG